MKLNFKILFFVILFSSTLIAQDKKKESPKDRITVLKDNSEIFCEVVAETITHIEYKDLKGNLVKRPLKELKEGISLFDKPRFIDSLKQFTLLTPEQVKAKKEKLQEMEKLLSEFNTFLSQKDDQRKRLYKQDLLFYKGVYNYLSAKYSEAIKLFSELLGEFKHTKYLKKGMVFNYIIKSHIADNKINDAIKSCGQWDDIINSIADKSIQLELLLMMQNTKGELLCKTANYSDAAGVFEAIRKIPILEKDSREYAIATARLAWALFKIDPTGNKSKIKTLFDEATKLYLDNSIFLAYCSVQGEFAFREAEKTGDAESWRKAVDELIKGLSLTRPPNIEFEIDMYYDMTYKTAHAFEKLYRITSESLKGKTLSVEEKDMLRYYHKSAKNIYSRIPEGSKYSKSAKESIKKLESEEIDKKS